MDYFLICRCQKLEQPIQGKQLTFLQVQLDNLLGLSHFQTESNRKKKSFRDLTNDSKFKEAVLYIVKLVNDLALNFTNIKLVSQQIQLFTRILPQQFAVRKISMPYIFTNFVDWKKICEQKYPTSCNTIQEIAKALEIRDFLDDSILSRVLSRLREEGVLEDTDAVFRKEHQGKVEPREEFSYFRCIGLPFQISKNQIVQKLIEPDRFNIISYGLSLIFQHGKFSGKAVIKIPAQFNQMILGKDRMYIGKRYVEIIQIHQEEYDSYKFREQRQRENSRRPTHASRSPPSDSESPSYSRSRSREKNVNVHNVINEAAIKVRGLPYSMNNWDVEEIFKRLSFIRGSIKLGYMGQLKSGEAVVLFPNRDQAERALALQGLVVQGRYLQLRLISKQNYDRFR